MEPCCGVYEALCIVNNKRYIGSSINCRARVNAHLKHLRKGIHNNNHLQSAWTKYGEAQIVWSVLEKVPRLLLEEREQHWIDFYKTLNRRYGFNHANPTRTGKPSPHSSRKTKAQWQDPAFQELMSTQVSATMLALCATPEKRRDLQRVSRAYWGQPKARVKQGKIAKRVWDAMTPEARAERMKGLGPRPMTRYLTIKDQTKSLKEWAVLSGMPYQLLLSRVANGYSLADTFKPSYKKTPGYRPTEQFVMEWLTETRPFTTLT